MIRKMLHRYRQFRKHPIASRNLMRSIQRYIWFNLMPANERIYNLVGDIRFFAKKGDAGIVPNIYTGLFEFEETGFLIHFLRKDDLFIDVGANLGEYTLLASGYADARTIAIEPIPATFKGLQRNVELNSLEEKVTLLNLGVASIPGELSFTIDRGAMNHVAIDNSGASFKCKVDTLDNLLVEQRPDLIKIDVEGFEKEVLNGSRNILKSAELLAVIVEMNESGVAYNSTNDAVHRILIENGFRPYQYWPFERRLSLLSEYRRDQFNTIYLRNLDEVARRLAKGRMINIFGLSY